MPPSSVKNIILSILVSEHELVDRLSAMDDGIDQRLAEIIPEGAARLSGYSHANAPLLSRMHIVGAKEKIVLLLLFYNSRRPHGALGPLNPLRIQDMRVLRPVDQVCGGKCVEKDLLPVRSRISGINPIFFPEYGRLRVGIPAREKGVAGVSCRNGVRGAGGGRCDSLSVGIIENKKAEKTDRKLPHNSWNLCVNIGIVKYIFRWSGRIFPGHSDFRRRAISTA